MICIITHHAYKRAKQRIGWRRQTVNRMADRAFTAGISKDQVKAKLRRYLDMLSHMGGDERTIKIYGHFIFIFCDNRLITVLDLPKIYFKEME